MEIERKFLICQPLPKFTSGKKLVQGYLFIDKNKEARVRLSDEHAVLTIKFKLNKVCREEFEYPIPTNDALNLLKLGSTYPPISKTRYRIIENKMTWEIDVFEDQNKGLILAEIELDSPEQNFTKPIWIGDEVTNDLRYYNANLYQNPYCNWKDQ